MNEFPRQTNDPDQTTIIWRHWGTGRIILLGIGLTAIYMFTQIVAYSALHNLFAAVGIGAATTIICTRILCRMLGSRLTLEFTLDLPPLTDIAGAALLAGFSLMPTSVLAGLSARIRPPSEDWIQFYNAHLPQTPLMIGLTMVIVTILVPLVEEIIFRGVFFRAGRRHWGFLGAALISALIFGLVHGEPWYLFGLTALGLLLAFVYETTQSITACAITHGLHNGVSLGLMIHGGGLAPDAQSDFKVPWTALALSVAGLILVIVWMQQRSRSR
jgi:membrane protease YdiL (CAAX protease family)